MHIEKAAVSAVAFFVLIQKSGRICYNNYS